MNTIAGLAWTIGIVLLFIEPPVGIAILAGAILITLWTRTTARRAAAASRSGQPKSFMGIAPGLAILAEIESGLESGEIAESEAEAQLEMLKGGTTAESQFIAMEQQMTSRPEATSEDSSTDEPNGDSAAP